MDLSQVFDLYTLLHLALSTARMCYRPLPLSLQVSLQGHPIIERQLMWVGPDFTAAEGPRRSHSQTASGSVAASEVGIGSMHGLPVSELGVLRMKIVGAAIGRVQSQFRIQEA